MHNHTCTNLSKKNKKMEKCQKKKCSHIWKATSALGKPQTVQGKVLQLLRSPETCTVNLKCVTCNLWRHHHIYWTRDVHSYITNCNDFCWYQIRMTETETDQVTSMKEYLIKSSAKHYFHLGSHLCPSSYSSDQCCQLQWLFLTSAS